MGVALGRGLELPFPARLPNERLRCRAPRSGSLVPRGDRCRCGPERLRDTRGLGAPLSVDTPHPFGRRYSVAAPVSERGSIHIIFQLPYRLNSTVPWRVGARR